MVGNPGVAVDDHDVVVGNSGDVVDDPDVVVGDPAACAMEDVLVELGAVDVGGKSWLVAGNPGAVDVELDVAVVEGHQAKNLHFSSVGRSGGVLGLGEVCLVISRREQGSDHVVGVERSERKSLQMFLHFWFPEKVLPVHPFCCTHRTR